MIDNTLYLLEESTSSNSPWIFMLPVKSLFQAYAKCGEGLGKYFTVPEIIPGAWHQAKPGALQSSWAQTFWYLSGGGLDKDTLRFSFSRPESTWENAERSA